MKAVCIDDEKLALDYLNNQLNKVKHIDVVGTFQLAEEGLVFILNEPIDVVFLDIHMPEMDGLQLAEKIIAKKPHIDIVFVTAYNEFAVTAFELNAIDYLLKPVKMDRLQKTIERLKTEHALKETSLVKTDKLHIRLGNSISFSVDNIKFVPIKWRTSKARELFLYLLQNNNTLVHKGSLMEQIWGVDELDRGYSILYTTVYNVRKAIQIYANYLELDNTNDGYILRLNNVDIDLHQWEKRIEELDENVNDESIQNYIESMELNSGPYLADYDYIWIEAEKQRMENIWLDAAQKIGNYYMGQNDFDNAITWFSEIAERLPEREDAHLSLMEIYAMQRKPHLVMKQYDAYVIAQKSYDLSPSLKVRKWMREYLDED